MARNSVVPEPEKGGRKKKRGVTADRSIKANIKCWRSGGFCSEELKAVYSRTC